MFKYISKNSALANCLPFPFPPPKKKTTPINRGHYITNPNFMHYYKGIPSKLPYICIKFDPPKNR